MSSLKPGSNRARLLAACSGEPSNVDQLLERADHTARLSELAGRKIINVLFERGLIARADIGKYVLTHAGEDELDSLFKQMHPEKTTQAG